VESVGSHIVQSLSGVGQALRAVVRGPRRAEEKHAVRREEDVVDVSSVEETEAVRRVGAEEEEESRGEREEHAAYFKRERKADSTGENLDLSA